MMRVCSYWNESNRLQVVREILRVKVGRKLTLKQSNYLDKLTLRVLEAPAQDLTNGLSEFLTIMQRYSPDFRIEID